MATAATVTIRLDGDSATLIRELNKANRASKSTFASMQKDAAAAAKGLGLVAAAAATAFGILVKQSFASIDALAKASDKIGISTQALAGLKLAASQSGVEFEGLTKSLSKMQRSLVDAAEKGGESADAYDRLGLSAQQLLKLTPERQLASIADAIAGVANPAERAATAMQIFGKSGADLLPLLNQGSGALDAYAQKAVDLGLAISRVDAKKIEEANDAFERAGEAVKGVANQFAIAFAPAVTAAAQGFENLVSSAKAFKGVAIVLADTFGGLVTDIGNSRAAMAVFSAVGLGTLTILINAGNLLRLAVVGIDLAFAGIEATFRRLKGERPFENIGTNAKGLQSTIETLRAKLTDLQTHNPAGVNNAGIAALKAQLDDASASLSKLGAAGKLAPLATELDRLRERRVDLSKLLGGQDAVNFQRQQIVNFTAQVDAAKRVIESGAKPGWIEDLAKAGIKGVTTVDELRDRVERLQRSIKGSQEFVAFTEPRMAGQIGQVRELDGQIADLQDRIKKGGGEILVKVPIDQPRSEYGKLLDYIDQQSKVAREIPLLISPDAILASAKEAADKVAAAFAAEVDAQPPAELQVLAAPPRSIDFSAILKEMTDAGAREQDLARQQAAAIQRIAVTGAESQTGELIRIAEQRAAALTDIEARSSSQQAAAAGVKDQFEREKALAKNRIKVAQDLAGEILAARQTVVDAGWAIRVDLTSNAGPAIQSLRDELSALQGQRVELAASLDTSRAKAALIDVETELAAVQKAIGDTNAGARLGIDASQARDALGDLQARLTALKAERIELAASLDTRQARTQLTDLDARIATTRASLGQATTGAVFSIDFEGAIAGIEAVNRRRAELTLSSNEEIRRIAIAGEQQISQDLQSTISAMAQNLVAIQRQQAQLAAATTGKPVAFDEQAALYAAQIQVANDAADALIAARERVAAGGPLALPTQDPEAIRANTQLAADAMLAAWADAGQQRIDAEALLNATIFDNNAVAGQALIELAAKQAYDKVLAEFVARGQALGDTGQFADPAAQAEFDKQVQDETLSREQAYLNQRLQMQQAFGARYGALNGALSALISKQWVASHKQGIAQSAQFATSALSIANSLFGDNKKVAIATAVIDSIKMAVSAGAETEGPWPVKAAAIAAALAAGYAQVQNIRSTNVGGGGGAGGGVSAGSLTTPAIPSLDERNLGNPAKQNAIQVIMQGDMYGWDKYVQERVVEGLRTAIDQRDVILFSNDSRQARELQGG